MIENMINSESNMNTIESTNTDIFKIFREMKYRICIYFTTRRQNLALNKCFGFKVSEKKTTGISYMDPEG